MYLTPPLRLRDICRRGGRKIIKGRGGRCHQRNSIFQTQQDRYTHELTEAGTARTRPGTVQARWNPCTEKRKWTPRPTLTESCWERSVPGFIDHIPGNAHAQERSASTDSVAFVSVLFVCYSCLAFFFILFISFDFCCFLVGLFGKGVRTSYACVGREMGRF